MTEAELDEYIAASLKDGYTIVQQGSVLKPAEGVSFNERVAGFDIKLLGSYGPPDWRSNFDNLLCDTDRRWVHLRRERR
jgi:hypothetical protein